MEITVYGATRSLHSGHYGNWAPVPGQSLAHLIATMKDENGKVLIDGFYDTVVPLSEFERFELSKIPDVDRQLKKELDWHIQKVMAEALMNDCSCRP